MTIAATLPDLDAPYGILVDSDPCDCACGHEEPACGMPDLIARPICEEGCYAAGSDVPFALDRWTCIGGTRYRLVDSRED